VIDLRTFTYIDILQPQLAAFWQTVSQGFLPLEGQASCYVEVAPGISINLVTDIALKRTAVIPGQQIVERAFGILELHHFDQGMVREAGSAILEFYGITEKDRLKPRILTSEIIHAVDGYQSMLLNRMRHGDLFRERQTLYVLEVHPAGYAAIAANEAEKAAPINMLEVTAFGAFGRMYLGGYEAEIDEARKAVHAVLESIEGRPNKG
jgi:hypothetical protein